MHRYCVHDLNALANALALRDGSGKYHVAQATSQLPAIGAELDGGPPSLGFTVLLCPSTRQFYRVIFERINLEDPVPHARVQ